MYPAVLKQEGKEIRRNPFVRTKNLLNSWIACKTIGATLPRPPTGRWAAGGDFGEGFVEHAQDLIGLIPAQDQRRRET